MIVERIVPSFSGVNNAAGSGREDGKKGSGHFEYTPEIC
jgi:hypothetical protein